jgi:competence ComEA-like helix-hairpin-helix protein
MPPELFVSPLPDIQGQVVPLPLHEVIRQLPPSLFSIQAKGKPVEPAESNDIPTPFHEKSAATAGEPTVAVPEPVAPVTEAVEATAPVIPIAAELPVVEEVPVAAPAQPAEFDDTALEDENFALFAEKSPVAATPAPEPEAVEPVAESSAAAEPRVLEEPASPEPGPVEVVAAAEPPPVEAVAPTEVVAAQKPAPASDFLINLNRCTFDDLQLIDGVGPALAKRIIDYRSSTGAFQSVYELRNVPGIGRKTFRALAGVPMRRLNRLLGIEHDQELSLPEIMRLVSALPGVEGCVLASSDGLPLTGNLPPQFDQERLSVFAPQLFKKVGRCTRELSVGEVNRLTLFTDAQPVSIFKAGTIYLVVVHNPDRFSKALLRRCANISEELARLCRQRAAV